MEVYFTVTEIGLVSRDVNPFENPIVVTQQVVVLNHKKDGRHQLQVTSENQLIRCWNRKIIISISVH